MTTILFSVNYFQRTTKKHRSNGLCRRQCFQFLIGTVQLALACNRFLPQIPMPKVSIPHRYGTTTDFIRCLVFIILFFPRFSTVLVKKVGLPRARNPLFPAFFKAVGGRPTFSLSFSQNQLFFHQKCLETFILQGKSQTDFFHFSLLFQHFIKPRSTGNLQRAW